MLAYHLGVEVAGAAGGDLLHGESKLCQTLSVVLGLQIAGQHSDSGALVHALEGALQQGSFSRARSADQIDAQQSELPVTLAQLFGQRLVLVEDFLLDGDAVHDSTSMYAMSSSSPLMH